jgi:predicted CoA-substrate-specific enzyme activase
MIVAGIDAGSRTTKAVLWDTDARAVIGRGVIEQGVEQPGLAAELFARLLREHALNREQVHAVVATGYGRATVEFATTTITEITCHARGVRHRCPAVRTVIEIGGQDSKLIRLNGDGIVRDFAMNDRCAAGTGRFLEMLAQRLRVPLADLGGLAETSRAPTAISSMCVVFAETEIVGLLASGRPAADIVAGVQAAITARVAAMAGRGVEPPICFTGGVALIPGMDHALARALGQPLAVAPDPMLTGALGAALLAAEREPALLTR